MINPKEAPEGLKAVKSVNGSCNGCVFNDISDPYKGKWCCESDCQLYKREDNQDVIFKDV